MGSHGRERPCEDGGNDWRMRLQPRGYQGGRGHWKGGEGRDSSPSEPPEEPALPAPCFLFWPPEHRAEGFRAF